MQVKVTTAPPVPEKPKIIIELDWEAAIKLRDVLARQTGQDDVDTDAVFKALHRTLEDSK